MEGWIDVTEQEDIERLMGKMYDFHDSCIASFGFVSGNYVDTQGTMHFGAADDYELHVVFHTQWGENVELCFTGVRRFHFVGLQDNYMNDIYGAHLDFYDDILPSEYSAPERTVVWADDAEFDPRTIRDELDEPATTYIVASALKWRFLE